MMKAQEARQIAEKANKDLEIEYQRRLNSWFISIREAAEQGYTYLRIESNSDVNWNVVDLLEDYGYTIQELKRDVNDFYKLITW